MRSALGGFDAAAVVARDVRRAGNMLYLGRAEDACTALEGALKMLGGMAGNTDLIDRSQPIGVSLSIPGGIAPAPVFYVPSTDPATYAASLPKGMGKATIAGNYVAVAMGGFRWAHPDYFFSDYELSILGQAPTRGKVAGLDAESRTLYTQQTQLPDNFRHCGFLF